MTFRPCLEGESMEARALVLLDFALARDTGSGPGIETHFWGGEGGFRRLNFGKPLGCQNGEECNANLSRAAQKKEHGCSSAIAAPTRYPRPPYYVVWL